MVHGHHGHAGEMIEVIFPPPPPPPPPLPLLVLPLLPNLPSRYLILPTPTPCSPVHVPSSASAFFTICSFRRFASSS